MYGLFPPGRKNLVSVCASIPGPVLQAWSWPVLAEPLAPVTRFYFLNDGLVWEGLNVFLMGIFVELKYEPLCAVFVYVVWLVS